MAPDLAVAWLCVPRCDGAPIFAGALDPRRGGSLAVTLVVDGQPVPLVPAGQRYVEGAAVLETRMAGGGWEVAALDWMPWGGAGLVRRLAVRGQGGGRVQVQVRVQPVRSAAWPAQAWPAGDRLWAEVPGAAVVVAAEVHRMAAGGAAAVASGSREVAILTLDLGDLGPGGSAQVTLRVGYGPDPAAAEAALVALAQATPGAEVAWWRRWLAGARPLPGPVPPRWEEAYWRSLVVLKLLSYEPTGALLAAPTASFPAVPGGSDNWDYRYCWLRDGYYTAMTLDAAGLHLDAARFYDFAFSLQGEDGHWHQPLYTVDGGDPAEFVVPDLAGPGGERPVRFGNAASGQLQLDNEGNVLHGLWFHYRTSGDREALARHWPAVRRAALWTAANWRRPESGIWEIREYEGHWVHGKAMCYAALTAAARIAAALGHEADAAAFAREAQAVRDHVLAGGWYPGRGAFLRHYGPGTPPALLDVSVLALAFYGLIPPDDPRMVRTVAAMEQPAAHGGLALYGGICRWEGAAVPFYLPTLWLARYYLMAGRTGDCDRLVNACLDASTDLLLMAEHFDGRDATQWGNFPQAFSHEEVARLVRERAQGWSYFAWEQPGAAGAGER